MNDITELRKTLKLKDSDLLTRLDSAYKSSLGLGELWNLCEEAAQRIRELEALVESAYREGFNDGYDDDARPQDADAGWEHSDVRKRLNFG